MSSERWRQVEELWQAAMERPAEARPAFLEQACGGDPELHDEVRGLVSAASAAGHHLEDVVGRCWVSMADELTTEAGGLSTRKPATERDLVGERFGYVQVQEKIGEGGMGRVYSGTDERLGRQVALKVLRPEWASDPRMVNRLQREARLLSQIEHPVICRIYDVIQTDEAIGLVLELVSGRSLRKLVAGGIERRQLLDWSIDLAEALAVAHSAGIVHRDLKPANIMLTDAGELKMLDFGIARLIDGAEPASVEPSHQASFGEETASGQISGTLAYMSPEQFRGEVPSPADDVFALGLVIYECLAGKPAYSRQELGTTFVTTVLQGRVPNLPDTGDALASLVTRLTAQAPGSRPSAADAAERLRSIREAPSRRRTRRLQILGVVLLAFFAMTMTWQARRVAQEAARANRALEKARLETERASQEAEAARQVVELLSWVLGVADPWSAGGADPAARRQAAEEALADGWQRLRSSISQDGPTRARLLTEVGHIAIGLELIDIAAEANREALALRLEHFGPRHALIAESLTSMADANFYLGNLQEGLEQARQAKRMLEELPDPHPELQIATFSAISRLAGDFGLLDEAVAAAETADAMATEFWGAKAEAAVDARFDYGLMLHSKAFFNADKEAMAEARGIIESTIAPTAEVFGKDHPSTALNLVFLGSATKDLGDLEEAQRLASDGVAILEKALGAGATETLLASGRLGGILRESGRLEEAAALYRRTIPLIEKRSGKESLDLLQSLREWALVQLELGDVDGSLATIERALAMARQEYGEENWEVSELEIHQGTILLAQGHISRAEARLASVLAKNQETRSGYIEELARSLSGKLEAQTTRSANE